MKLIRNPYIFHYFMVVGCRNCLAATTLAQEQQKPQLNHLTQVSQAKPKSHFVRFAKCISVNWWSSFLTLCRQDNQYLNRPNTLHYQLSHSTHTPVMLKGAWWHHMVQMT